MDHLFLLSHLLLVFHAVGQMHTTKKKLTTHPFSRGEYVRTIVGSRLSHFIDNAIDAKKKPWVVARTSLTSLPRHMQEALVKAFVAHGP